MEINLAVERVRNRCLAILENIEALQQEGDGALIRAAIQLDWDHIQLLALLDAMRNVN